jgi:23S rRNA (adenine2503-C2)-methyltransferase
MGERAFRGRQLAGWVYKKAVASFDEMPDLPASFRAALASSHVVNPLIVADHKRSSDQVDKLLVHGGDGEVFECVLLPYEDRVSCCLSSQVGCPMGCTFCATGLGGFDRNLSAAEIVGQYLLLQGLSERRIGHVVFMGMGEPLLNLDQLVRAMGVLHDEVGLSYRHLTVSTVGLVPQIKELAKLKLPIHLALSLHSPFDEVRDRLMPVNQKWPVAEVVQTMRDYSKTTGRKVTFEYLLIDQVNDTPDQADALAKLVSGLPSVVNLIPFNTVDTEQGFARPKRERVQAFRRRLESHGVNVTERVERGHDIAAACGQLAGQHKGRFARRRTKSELPVVS